MRTCLACRIFQRELEMLGESDRVDYFDPMCHRLGKSEFLRYVASLADGHAALLCGDCGGLSRVAADKGMRIPPYDDCIDILIPGMGRDPKTLYLTDGWMDNFDIIFGLDRLPTKARTPTMRVLFSGMLRIAYIFTGAASERKEDARRLARLLGCDFVSFPGSLSGLSRSLEELEE
jgi:hypothetical protein